MKLQGKITHWNDDKGFGFVEPDGGGRRAFVHIKAFKPRSRRPVDGEAIVYTLAQERDGRYKAVNIKFAADHSVSGQRSKASNSATLTAFTQFFVGAFCLLLLGSVVIGRLPLVIAGLYAVMSLIIFIVYALDKSAARDGRWRTRESTLHILSLLGGWPGAYYAQEKLRHKSSKTAFKSIYWLTVLLNLGGLFWLYTESGRRFLSHVLEPLLGT